MSKKLLVLVVSLMLVLGLVACGKKEDPKDEAGDTTPTTEVTAEATPEATPEPTTPPLANDGTPFGDHGKLAVTGTDLVDALGNKFQLKGMSTHGIAWFPAYVNKESFTTLRDEFGANAVRLAMYTWENMGYCKEDTDKEYTKGLVTKGVELATELGMYVIIDWHVLNDKDPNVHIDEAKLFFEEMSKNYGDQDNVIYELCNEPNGSTSWADVKGYAEQIIPIIRANDPDAIIIVGTPEWSQKVDSASKDPITDYDNIMYAIHFYAGTHKQWLRDRVTTAVEAGLPIFCTEFGITDASGNGKCDIEEANEWIKTFDECNISYMCWNLSNKNESSAIIDPNCDKLSGWEYEDLQTEGKWFVDVLGGKLSKGEVGAYVSTTGK